MVEKHVFGIKFGSILVIFWDNFVFLEAPGTRFLSWLPFWFVLGDFEGAVWGLSPVKGSPGAPKMEPKWRQSQSKTPSRKRRDFCSSFRMLMVGVGRCLGTLDPPN